MSGGVNFALIFIQEKICYRKGKDSFSTIADTKAEGEATRRLSLSEQVQSASTQEKQTLLSYIMGSVESSVFGASFAKVMWAGLSSTSFCNSTRCLVQHYFHLPF